MMKINREGLLARFPILKDIQEGKEIVWVNPDKTDFQRV